MADRLDFGKALPFIIVLCLLLWLAIILAADDIVAELDLIRDSL
jgi:hypothetical protein